jgi:predicted Ser/Thr protein kinase
MRPLGESDRRAIASYKILGVLGGGGMGKVYLGESRSGRRVAIKVIRSDLAEDPVFRRRFAREVAAVRAVSPLFTAAVVDADPSATEPWLATTYIDGPSLGALVSTNGPLAPAAVLILAAGLSEGLASIHRSGLIHRDLKPSNVIITDQGPHIIDFGIALAADSTGATNSLLLGTPSYIAPERIYGNESEPASDIFSLGATLVYAATGRPLVNEAPVYAQLMQITTGRFDLDAVPLELRPLITRCVSPRAKDRPSADELSRILAAAAVPAPTPGWFATEQTAPTVPVHLTRGLLTRRQMLVAGGVLGAAAAASAVAAVVLQPAPPVAYGMRPQRSPSAVPTTPPPPPRPGTVLWQLRSGAVPVASSPGQVPAGQRILVDAARVVTVVGSDVVATRPNHDRDWQTSLSAGLVTLRRWGDGVLVNDARRLWLLDGDTGVQRFLATVADDEERFLGVGAGGAAVEIGDIALAPDRVFLSLGTATIALDRSGTRLWRVPRPPRQGPEVHPPAGGPVAADAAWLLTHMPTEDGAQVALRSAKNGGLSWTTEVPPADPASDNPPPGGGPPGGNPPPPGGSRPEPDKPGSDVDWYRIEGRLTSTHAVLREARNIRAFKLSDGAIWWQRLAPAPVVSVQVIGDLVVVGGDRLTAVSLANGAQRWQAAPRGARIAGTQDGRLIIAASEDGIAAVSPDGANQWQVDLPPEFVDVVPDHVSTDAHTAFVTFKPRRSRPDPLDVDVLAIALDENAVRPSR